jgi:hypothetical protein
MFRNSTEIGQISAAEKDYIAGAGNYLASQVSCLVTQLAGYLACQLLSQ